VSAGERVVVTDEKAEAYTAIVGESKDEALGVSV
jgi:hypothetical protein